MILETAAPETACIFYSAPPSPTFRYMSSANGAFLAEVSVNSKTGRPDQQPPPEASNEMI
jgi:hypothetical protein